MKTCILVVMGFIGAMAGGRAQAQTGQVYGLVIDSLSRRPLEKAVVCVVPRGGRDSLRVSTDTSGIYDIKKVPPGDVFVVISFVGYRTQARWLRVGTRGDLGTTALVPQVRDMQEVVIEAPAVRLKEDTVEYRSDAYPVRKDAVLEDLLRKLPGFQVDQNGNITAYGRPVTKIRIGGKDFFLGDPKLATQNIPAEVIDKIQVIDDKSEQARLTGFDDGEREQVINLTIKKNRTDSYFGNVTAGAGTDDRYLAAVRAFRFDQDQQLAVIGGVNNTNGTNITSGATTSGPPDNHAGSMGVDFSGKLAPHLTVNGSYNYNTSHSITDQWSRRDYFLDTSYVYIQQLHSDSRQQSHSIQMALGYGWSKRDSMIFRPSLNYSINHQQTANAFLFEDQTGAPTSQGTQAYSADNSSPNLSGTLTWLHRFAKMGRTLTANVNAGPGPVRETDNNFSTNHIYTPALLDTIWQTSDIHTRKQQYSGSVNYTEPLGKDKNLEVSYNFARNENLSAKNVYDVSAVNKTLNDSLTNSFDNALVTHKLSVNFRQGTKKYNYQLGLGLQPTYLESRSVLLDTPRTFRQASLEVIPIASFYYQFSTNRRIHFYYNGYTQQPSISQLQPVPDYTNPLYVAEGNPNLKPSFNHTFRISYNDLDRVTGRSFFLSGYSTIRENAIVNNITLLTGGKQVIQPVNIQGNYSVSGSYDYSLPVVKRVFTLSASGNVGYTNNVSLQSGERNTGRNWTGRQGLRLVFSKGKWLDLTSEVNYNFNNNVFSLDPTASNRVSSWGFNQEGRVDFWGDCSLRYNFGYTLNENVPPGVSPTITLMSMVLEKRIFRERGVLGLSVNDLLNNNVGYSHSFGQGYTEDDQSTVMGRFVLASFTWKFQQFRAGAKGAGGVSR
jgi:hypothetical protein